MYNLFLIGAAESTPAYQTVITTVSTSLSESNLASVLTYAMGIAVVLYLFWFSARKVLSIVRRAFAKGKLRL